MKIVFISPSFYPAIGGVETHVYEVARELTRRKHEVVVVTEEKNKKWQLKGKSDNKAKHAESVDKSRHFTHTKLDQIDIYYFKFGQPSFVKKFKIWYLLFKNYKLFIDADIIHVHDVFIWYLPLRFLLFRKKVFTTFHGYEGRFPPENKAVVIRKLSNKLSYGSINVGNFIEKWYETKPDYITHGAVKKVKFSAKKVTKGKRIKILLVGRLEKDISIQVYLDTLKMIKQKGGKFLLTVIGDGSYRTVLEQYGKVLGFKNDVRRYIKRSDIVFASSYLLILESLQLGKPVFSAYSNPLKHDYLHSSPFKKYITVSNDSEKLSTQVLKGASKEKQLRASRWASAQTWEKLTNMYIELWNKK